MDELNEAIEAGTEKDLPPQLPLTLEETYRIALQLFSHNANSPLEIRTVSKPNISMYTRSIDEAVKKLLRDDNQTYYIVMNEINPACYSRSQCEQFRASGYSPKLKQYQASENGLKTTSDLDIIRRRRILIDFDPKRSAEVSSTAPEKLRAYVALNSVVEYLADHAFPEPVICDSGNGYHLLFNTDLPPEDDTIPRFLKALASKFPSEAVSIDSNVGNAARITKVYGTMARKGANTPERPHRRSGFIYIPEEFSPVKEDAIRAVIDEIEPKSEPPIITQNYTQKSHSNPQPLDVEKWLNEHNISYKKGSGEYGSTKYSLAECGFNSNHQNGDAAIFQYPDGAISYKCLHDSCRGKKWQDYRQLYEPGCYDIKPKVLQKSESFARMVSRPEEDPSEVKTEELFSAMPAASFGEDKTEFVWYPYIPVGDYTVLMSPGGTGKTYFTCGIAAAISKGAELPGDFRPAKPETVLIISAEDRGEMLKQRLDASGADLSKVLIIDCMASVGMDFSDHYEDFKETIKRYAPKLVIIDPWHAFLGDNVDINRVNVVRPKFQRLANIAKELQCGMILISHVNKRSQGENVNNAATGSTDFVNAARSALYIIFDEEDEDGRIVVHTKSNYARYGDSVKFRIVNKGIHWDGFSKVDRQTMEQAARQKKTPGEVIKNAEDRHKTRERIIRALLEVASPVDDVRFTYDGFRERFGEDIFGSGQPKRVLDSVAEKLANKYELITGIQVKRGNIKGNGFLIRPLQKKK